MRAAISLLVEDWTPDVSDEQSRLVKRLTQYVDNPRHVTELKALLQDDRPVEVIDGVMYLDQVGKYAAWLRILPSALLSDTGHVTAIEESYDAHFSQWRQNTPAWKVRPGEVSTPLPSPFGRGFRLLQSSDNGKHYDLSCDFVSAGQDAKRWDLVAYYGGADRLPPFAFDTESGPREVEILKWFVLNFSPMTPPKGAPEYNEPYRVTVQVDRTLRSQPYQPCLAKFLALVGDEGFSRDVSIVGGKPLMRRRVKVDFKWIASDDLPDTVTRQRDQERANLNERKSIFVLAKETSDACQKLFAAPPAAGFFRSRQGAPPPQPFRVIVDSDAKVTVSAREITAPERALIVWDCVWEAVFREAKATTP